MRLPGKTAASGAGGGQPGPQHCSHGTGHPPAVQWPGLLCCTSGVPPAACTHTRRWGQLGFSSHMPLAEAWPVPTCASACPCSALWARSEDRQLDLCCTLSAYPGQRFLLDVLDSRATPRANAPAECHLVYFTTYNGHNWCRHSCRLARLPFVDRPAAGGWLMRAHEYSV